MWSESERCPGCWHGRLAPIAVALALVVAAGCGPPVGSSPDENPAPAAAAPVAEHEPAPPSPTSPESEPLGIASAPEVSVLDVSVPTTPVAVVAAPEASVPEVSVPEVAAPEVSVPELSVPEVVLPVATEYGSGYDRDDWGPHNSDICRGASGTPDPYTGTPIDTCNVDHVVALHEAHESGGWDWPASAKRQFSQDSGNHVASRACVNQSKGADDIFEWSDADIASSSACGGGYTVTAAGRCFLAVTTVAVKSAWGLTVDQAEADTLGATLARCGDQAPEISVVSQDTSTAAVAPTTTTAVAERCVIANKTEAQYDAVSGIGEVLSARLVTAQPFSSRSQLEAVRGIGPARSEAVWSHFCGP